jgi:exodeoxyribonuclease VII small subunit
MPPRKTSPTTPPNAADHAGSAVDTLDFEAAMAELEQLIQAVENNRLPLEETLQSYQRGQQLIARCSTLLRDAEERIRQFDGEQLIAFTPAERA